MILDKVLRFFIVALSAVAGAALMRLASPILTQFVSTEILKTDMGIFRLTLASLLCLIIGCILGGIVGWLLTPFFLNQLKRFSAWVESQLNRMPMQDAISGAAGLAIGLIIANLLGVAFSRIPMVGDYVPVIFSLVFGYLGIHIMVKKGSDIIALFDVVPKLLKELVHARGEKAAAPETVQVQIVPDPSSLKAQAEEAEKPLYKLLDTSVIIDGRIADIINSGFLEGTLLIPVFVLEELQHIADSPDPLKRMRGRRGLDILQKIRTEAKMPVEISNQDFDDIAEVDSKLVQLGQMIGGKIITNDYNLNKVSELRGVPVLNINELANAVKPLVIPGESMQVTVIKDGKEHGQGIAYLDDGTMIVIENGHRHLNSTISVSVTSALQTAAGRMIFAKPINAKSS